jgi:hypothetical protein
MKQFAFLVVSSTPSLKIMQTIISGRTKLVSPFSIYLPYARLVRSLVVRKKKPHKITSLIGFKPCLHVLSTTPHSILTWLGEHVRLVRR